MTGQQSLSARRAWIEMLIIRKHPLYIMSLSARRAWIEMSVSMVASSGTAVALRKESVDRNDSLLEEQARLVQSLSARRAWIEMSIT